MPDAKDPKAQRRRLKKEPEVFHIHSLVRDVSTKLQRTQAPGRQRFKQMLGGGLLRLVRRRPVPISHTLLVQLLPELQAKEAAGILKVTLPTGQRVDLSTLKSTEQLSPVAPKLQRPLDSVARDETFEHGVGIPLPQQLGGVPQGVDLPLPKAIRGMPVGMDDTMGVEGEVTVVELISPSLEEGAKALYDKHTKAALTALAEERGLDTAGTKMEVATRLATSGYRG